MVKDKEPIRYQRWTHIEGGAQLLKLNNVGLTKETQKSGPVWEESSEKSEVEFGEVENVIMPHQTMTDSFLPLNLNNCH